MKIKAGYIQLIIILLFVVFCVFLSKFLENDTMENPNYVAKPRQVFVPTTSLTPQDFRESFKVTGIVEAREEIEIIPQVSGRVVWVNDKLFKGEEFKAGEPLFEIDRFDYDINLIKSEAELARAYMLLETEKAENELALEEWKTLQNNQEIPDLVARKPQMQEAEAGLKSALAKQEQARIDLERTIFKLPFASRLIKGTIGEGQFLASGRAYGTVYNSKLLRINSSLTSKQLRILSQSTEPKINIEVDTIYGSKIYQGYLEKVAAYLDQTTRYTNVSFGFDQIDQQLVPGNFAKIIVTGNLVKNVLKIPASSIQNNHDLFLVDADNIVLKVAINIIDRQNEEVIIQNISLPKQLAEYRLITKKVPGIFAGMKVITKNIGQEN